MTLFASISYFDVTMALLFVGMAERLLLAFAPTTMVGPEGWLIRNEVEK